MLRHVGIVVEDLELQLRFYVDALGFQVLKRDLEQGPRVEHMLGMSGVAVETVKLRRGDAVIELLKFHRLPAGVHSRLASPGISHISLGVRDVSQVAADLHVAGASLVSKPQDMGRAIVCFVRDYEGNHLELVEEKP